MISGQYDLVNGKNTNALWQTLLTTDNKKRISDYSILISSVKDIRYNTRYYIRVADTLTINRNGRTHETIVKDAYFNVDTNVETTTNTYTVTKKTETYKTLGLALSVYMGLYSSAKHGLTTTMAPAKTTFTIGGAILINAGLTISIGAIRLKHYFGSVTGTLGVRTRLAAKYKESTQSLTQKRSVKIRNTLNRINRPVALPASQEPIYARLAPPPLPFRPPRPPFRRRIIIHTDDSENEQYSQLNFI